MNVFKKLFSGAEKSDNNVNSEYLNDAYNSLSDEANLNPDRIIDENSRIVQEGSEIQEVSQTNESGVSIKTDSRQNDISDNYNDYQDDSEGVFGVPAAESEAEYELDETADMQGDSFDAEEAYGVLSGDTGELDTEAIKAEAERIDNYISSLSKTDEVNEINDDNDGAENGAAESLDADKDLIYSAYAPKNMRPQITQTAYYDLDDMDDDNAEEVKSSRFSAFLKRRAKLIMGGAAAAVVVVGIIVACVFIFSGGLDPLMGYTQINAVKGNVIKTMAAGGNVEPNARYEITPLVNGTITESPLNAGEEVKAGELVYKVDDTNAQLAVQMAENAVERAKVSGTSSNNDNLRIYANSDGTITDLKISNGSTITGGQIATIRQSNGTEIGLIPSVTGTVQSLNVREGSSVTSGQVIATLRSSSSSSPEGQKLDVAGSELALQQAKKDLEKYKIASPIDGTILVKSAKIGDNVIAGNTDSPLMVIADMSKMKFTIEVDELDIWNIQLGQTVVITANALPGETFSGEITNIAGEGEKKGSGVTTYAVEITISDPGKIKSGMNVDAKIIINSAINVLSLPEKALYESDGQNALVITNSSSADEEDTMNPVDYPNINIPDGYKLVKVKYGVSDGTNVEITSGLSVGDIVLYKEDGSEPELNTGDNPNSKTEDTGSSSGDKKNAGTVSEFGGSANNSSSDDDEDDDRGENVKSTGKSALQSELDI